MRFILFLFVLAPLLGQAQYCQPTQGSGAIAPVISLVKLGTINNPSGFGLTDYGYSDYTAMSTSLAVGETHSLTIETGDFFPHNIGVWIDYDRNGAFSEEERIDNFVIGGSDPISKEIEFELPPFATNGMTRLRVRGMLEPFGPWFNSMDPCLPVDGDGEIEDYTVEITNGLEGSISISKLLGLESKITLGEESISVEIHNLGSIPAENILAVFKVDDTIIFSESMDGVLDPDHSTIFTFSEMHDFSGIACSNISVEVEWVGDENLTDNIVGKNICALSPLNGEQVWYLHSNINGGVEPLGDDPFFSTTNEVTMNTVFGENNWNQGCFETTDINAVFSDSSCVVFLDGSYDHNLPLESLMADYAETIENWVAAGGNLFINCAIELSEEFYIPIGFDETILTFYQVGYASIVTDHPLLDGPHQPLSGNLVGFYYANSVIVGEDLIPIAYETNEEGGFYDPVLHIPILAEKSWGEGIIIFGGLSPSQLVSPMTESMNLRANILEYLHDCTFISVANKEASLEEVMVFPNPVNKVLHVDAIRGNASISIMNSSGQFV